jgi:hypothetical protein
MNKDKVTYIPFTKPGGGCKLKWSDVIEALEESKEFLGGVQIIKGNKISPITFLYLKYNEENRIYGTSGFSATDKNSQNMEYIQGSNSISSIESGNVTMLLMSDNRLNSPYCKHIFDTQLIVYGPNRKQKKLF